MAIPKRYDHANEERYGGAIEALDEAGKTGKTGKAEALAAASWKQRSKIGNRIKQGPCYLAPLRCPGNSQIV